MDSPSRHRQFACVECRRSIVVIAGPWIGEDLCLACLMLPGWFREPDLRARIDADHDGRDPADRLPSSHP